MALPPITPLSALLTALEDRLTRLTPEGLLLVRAWLATDNQEERALIEARLLREHFNM
jgi:hypothetical protein